MSFVSEREQRLILDLLSGRISEEDFYREFPTNPGEVSAVALAMLQRALQERDPVGAEFGLYLAHRFGITNNFLDVLLALANVPWHQRHEDVIEGLAALKNPASVDALYQAALARHPYLEYDDAFALGTKSIYALGAIETREAVSRLGELLHCGNSILETEAKAQLKRIAKAGRSDSARNAAWEILNS